jgi:hypothetical protein
MTKIQIDKLEDRLFQKMAANAERGPTHLPTNVGDWLSLGLLYSTVPAGRVSPEEGNMRNKKLIN